MKKLRLVKVLVQPVFVIEEDGELEEIEHPVMGIPAKEWPTYSSERFPREVKAWEKQLNEPSPPPNRAARRAAARKKPKPS